MDSFVRVWLPSLNVDAKRKSFPLAEWNTVILLRFQSLVRFHVGLKFICSCLMQLNEFGGESLLSLQETVVTLGQGQGLFGRARWKSPGLNEDAQCTQKLQRAISLWAQNPAYQTSPYFLTGRYFSLNSKVCQACVSGVAMGQNHQKTPNFDGVWL